MYIIDIFISSLRKIDKNEKFEIVEKIRKVNIKEFITRTLQTSDYVIILDETGVLKNDIIAMGGLYAEVKKVGIGYIDIKYPTKSEDEEINMEDYKLIGVGTKDNFAKNSIRKQSMVLGLSLGDFILDTSKSISLSKYLLVSNKEVLDHWGVKSSIKVLRDRNFKCVLMDN